ncbi:histidine--tRNA ligase [candidate division WOR-1 bacterium RIFOXYA2_FULL_37_7]|uniref:Histidine--tRNA ligase n=1 Tax=candidate division WOR-1 bacterium RIFOXYB2_FULL_37_13 TaxID=1802579 RepID=A0A1F4SW22_UNCSA|nr:MAG: histidine--tRNA ligase [candidate division WOR-1 bacterium RIFOXYA2_FULL_37_7]OGC24639.1 MAG: histidine--tRNA ligase [candidate division WOR-1 bacterium RIFOXYB2_FULL_37_13]
MKYTSQRGTRDILPVDMPVWHNLEKNCRKLFELYNYFEIRTPIFESTELFARSIGESSDIVSKEMYTFKDKGDRSITLRPEATAPVVRAAIQNNLIEKDKITKLYYMGPMFRYERPQAGRYRQFYQSGVEVFGSKDPALDAEVISLSVQIMDKLGLSDLSVKINSVGCKSCRPKYMETLKEYFKSNAKNLCETCNNRLETNPLRILDCKDPSCQKHIENAPAIIDFLCEECKTHFEKVIYWLNVLNIKYEINKRLVRGLDYYTKTTFEIVSGKLGAQNAVCGGGRYDNLVVEFGGNDTPAIGFAIGMDRMVEVLKEHGTQSTEHRFRLLYIATLGDAAKKLGVELLLNIRKSGYAAEMDYIGKSLKSQMKEADRIKAKYVLILGEDEIKSGKAMLRNMETAEQGEVLLDKVLEEIIVRLQSKGSKF